MGLQHGCEGCSLARYRSGLYELASAMFFDAPSRKCLEDLVGVAVSENEHLCARHSEKLLMRGLASFACDDYEALRERVASEYAELFVGPRPPLAPLYESVYLGFPNRLFTEQTELVRATYEKNGFTTGEARSVPDDGVFYELSFMKELCDEEAAAFEQGNDGAVFAARQAQFDFLSDHLGAWSHLLAERIGREFGDGFYSLWAEFVDAFVREDLELLCDEGSCQ